MPLPPDRTRKPRVTNLPEKARKGDMLLTPGLAAGVVLEVSFSSATNSGWLEVVEASMPLLLNGRPVRGRVSLRDGDVVHLRLALPFSRPGAPDETTPSEPQRGGRDQGI